MLLRCGQLGGFEVMKTIGKSTKCAKTFAAVGIVILSLSTVLIYTMRLNIDERTNAFSLPNHSRILINRTEQISNRIPYSKKDHYICPAFDGGIGNQMFQFASSYGIARHKNMKVLIPETCKLMSIFNFSVVIVKDISVCKSFRTIRERQNAIFDNRLMSFDASLNVRLTIYLQSHRYFNKFKSDLRKQFTFRREIQSQANSFMDKTLQLLKITCKTKYTYLTRTDKSIQHGNCFYSASIDKVTLVGVHVRRGDWLKQPHPSLGFQTASKEYLQKSIDWYQKRYPKIIFIVASNGMAWTKENIPKNITVVYLENSMPWVDMAVLAMCDHFIATVGTFGWWAGWLAGGNVTYYKWPAREHTQFRRSFNKDFSDHFYPTWIGL